MMPPPVTPPQPWQYADPKTCTVFLEKIGQAVGELGWCPGLTDEVLCWPTAAPGDTISQLCPRMQGVDPTKYAKKTCNMDGRWWSSAPDQGLPGYTDYNDCFTEETQELMEVFFDSNNSAMTEERMNVVFNSRAIEMTGFPLSLICVIISLVIFRYFRSLRCARTTIHVHLFLAIAIMTLCKTIEYADQYISGYATQNIRHSDTLSLRNTRAACEILVILIEYSRTAMFMWMFLEGLYMHNVVAWKVFSSSKPNYWIYCATGWGFPAILVSAWAPVIEFVWKQERGNGTASADKCWYNHANSHFYKIIDVPRLTFIGINLFFLVHIIFVLLTKLRNSHQSDTVQIRKAVKATIVLAPLLGVTHLLWAIPPPLDSKWPLPVFAGWMYVSHFLRSFEGIFVCLVYCFLNGEVQAAFKTAFERRALQQETNRSAQARRVSSLSSSHLTRYMSTNSSSANKRGATNRILKLLNCWPTNRQPNNHNNGSLRIHRNHNSSLQTDGTTLQLPINGTILEEKEEIEM
ncbi:PDF receptor [Hypsibius exemplaris]|uniref:PDF receptor n=1 Tax=Hypsibius exemplaris TaxID=2072580 RepID=A0A1W0WDC1_HYPEX|nr:PDF receptor [Hypsibius exemplaris]